MFYKHFNWLGFKCHKFDFFIQICNCNLLAKSHNILKFKKKNKNSSFSFNFIHKKRGYDQTKGCLLQFLKKQRQKVFKKDHSI